MLIAKRLNPIAFPPLSRLPADLTSDEGFQSRLSNRLNNFFSLVIHMDSQLAKLFFHLQKFKLKSARPLEFSDQWF